MVKHTQTIRREIADELFGRVLPFCGIRAQRVKEYYEKSVKYDIDVFICVSLSN